MTSLGIYSVIQATVVTLIVTFSAVQILRKLMPKTARRIQARFAATLRGTHMPAAVRRAGEKLQPVAVAAKGCGDDSGCGTCNTCGTIANMISDLPPR